MFGAPSRERAALETTYEDVAEVRRTVEVAEGSITETVPDAVIYGSIACALSAGSDSSHQTGAQNSLRYDAKIFCAPELDIRAGDDVRVRRFGRERRFSVVGVPFLYATHQEVKVREVGLA